MTWFLESPIPIIVVGIAVEIALVAMLLLTGRASALLGVLAVAVLAGLGVVVERVVVTDREQIEEMFDRAQEAVKAHDTNTIVAMLDPQVPGLRDQARKHLSQFKPQDVEITDLRIAVDSSKKPPTATADVFVVVTLREGRVPERVLVSLRKDGDTWFMTHYEHRDLIERKH